MFDKRGGKKRVVGEEKGAAKKERGEINNGSEETKKQKTKECL